MDTFINMDFDSNLSKWWVEYKDSNNDYQIIYFDTKEEAIIFYNSII